MIKIDKTVLANTTQALLWVGGILWLYFSSTPEDAQYRSSIGFIMWGIYSLVFFTFIYMARANTRSGVVLKKNYKDVREAKKRTDAGEKFKSLEGDEFSRSVNYEAGFNSLKLVTAFMVSIWLFSFLYSPFDVISNRDGSYLLDSVPGNTMLIIVFSFTSLTGIIQLFKSSPEITESSQSDE